MSGWGQQRHLGGWPVASGLPREADHSRARAHFAFGPTPEVSRLLDHSVGAFFLAQASRLYKQEARVVLA
jgi:hypothetical protein